MISYVYLVMALPVLKPYMILNNNPGLPMLKYYHISDIVSDESIFIK